MHTGPPVLNVLHCIQSTHLCVVLSSSFLLVVFMKILKMTDRDFYVILSRDHVHLSEGHVVHVHTLVCTCHHHLVWLFVYRPCFCFLHTHVFEIVENTRDCHIHVVFIHVVLRKPPVIRQCIVDSLVQSLN